MSVGKHTLTNLVGNMLPMVVSLITVPLYLSYIGAERYGVLAVIWGLLGYFGFIDLGFGQAVAQRMARFSNAENSERSNLLWTGITSTFLLGLLGGLMLWIFADYILIHLIDMSESSRKEASSTIIWLSLAFPLVLIASTLRGALQARLRFTELNVIEVLSSLLTQILPLAVAANGYIGLQYLVPAALFSRLVTVSLLFWFCRRHVPLIGFPMINRSHLKGLMHYGGWISVFSLIHALAETVDRVFIATLNGASSVANYIVPYTLVTRVLVISTSLSNAIFPRLASASDIQAKEMALRATTILVAIMTPIVIAGIILVQSFLNLWVGETFASASAGVAEIILLGVWIHSLVIPTQAWLLAAGNPKIVTIISIFVIPIYVLMLWMGIVYWGIIGAAAAWSMRVLLNTVFQLYFAGVLVHTFKSVTPNMIIVIAVVFVSLETEVQSPLRWVLGLILLVLALLRDKDHLYDVMNALRKKTKLSTL